MVVTHIIEAPVTRNPADRSAGGAVRTAIIIPVVLFAIGCSASPDAARDSEKPPSYWVQALQSPDPQVRKKAADALGKVTTTDPATVPALVKALDDDDAKVRDAAVLALSKMGRVAERAADALDKLNSDPDRAVRQHAAQAAKRVRGMK
jgi:oligoendopeptidase F